MIPAHGGASATPVIWEVKKQVHLTGRRLASLCDSVQNLQSINHAHRTVAYERDRSRLFDSAYSHIKKKGGWRSPVARPSSMLYPIPGGGSGFLELSLSTEETGLFGSRIFIDPLICEAGLGRLLAGWRRSPKAICLAFLVSCGDYDLFFVDLSRCSWFGP